MTGAVLFTGVLHPIKLRLSYFAKTIEQKVQASRFAKLVDIYSKTLAALTEANGDLYKVLMLFMQHYIVSFFSHFTMCYFVLAYFIKSQKKALVY